MSHVYLSEYGQIQIFCHYMVQTIQFTELIWKKNIRFFFFRLYGEKNAFFWFNVEEINR